MEGPMALLTRAGLFAIIAWALAHLGVVPPAAGQTRTALSGSCLCQSDAGSAGGTCQLLPLAQAETFDMTDVTVASTGSDPVLVGIGESPGAVFRTAYAVNGIGTISQFYLSAIRVNGSGGGVYVRCST